METYMLHKLLVLILNWAATSHFIDRKYVFIWTPFMFRITSLQWLISWAKRWQHLHEF